MITIPIRSVKSFKQKASKIQNNKILPICDYIRLVYSHGICTFTKTNTHAFVMEDFDADGKEDQEYLIPEADLFAFVEHSFDEFLTIKKDKKGVILSDGESSDPCLSTDDTFPNLEVPEDGDIELSPLVVKQIKTASKVVANEEMPTWRSFVFVGKKRVIGCDGFVALSVPCEIEDEIIFRKEVAASLPDVGAIYKQNKSYDFFECGRSLYGFAKSEQKFFDMTGGIKVPEVPCFELPKDKISSCNDWILALTNKPEFAGAIWQYEKGELVFKGEDSFSEKNIERRIKVPAGAEFKYLPMHMNKILKSIDTEILYCYRGEKNLCITDENQSFISLIQQIV